MNKHMRPPNKFTCKVKIESNTKQNQQRPCLMPNKIMHHEEWDQNPRNNQK